MKNKALLLSVASLIALFSAQKALAICPVCTVAVGAGSIVMPGQARVLALGSNTYIVGIVQGASTYYSGANGILHVETGN